MKLGKSMNKKTFLLVLDYDAIIGNLSEKLHFALFKAERLNKKILFVRKKVFFDKVLRKYFKYKQLKAIFKIKNQHIVLVNPMLRWLISIYFGLIFCIRNYTLAALYKLKIKKSFDFKYMGSGFDDVFNINRSKIFNIKDIERYDWSSLLEKKYDFSFSKEDESVCREQFKTLGIAENQPYICLHIRTGVFHNDHSFSSYRNSTIDHYIKAITFLRSQGYQVIRMGDPVSLGFEDLYIDYPNSEIKSELMDLYLIKNCYFYFGTNSGILDTAFLFGKPVLAVNVSDLLYTKPYKSTDIFIYKTIFSKRANRCLTFDEVFNEPFYVNSNTDHEHFWKFHETYDLQENTADEIYNATHEMVSLLKSPQSESDLQATFKTSLNNAIAKWISEADFFSTVPEEAYRVMIKTFFNGRIGNDFSKKYLT